MAAGATGSPAAQAAAEGPFVAGAGQAVRRCRELPGAEGEPELPGVAGELTNTEDRMQTARRFYNANVRDFNRRIQAFPSMIIASMFHFKEEEFFEIERRSRGGRAAGELREAGPSVSFGDSSGGGAPAPAAPRPRDAAARGTAERSGAARPACSFVGATRGVRARGPGRSPRAWWLGERRS